MKRFQRCATLALILLALNGLAMWRKTVSKG
jgi:hypothetical protein